MDIEAYPYVLLTNPGTDEQYAWSDHRTFESAVRAKRALENNTGRKVDIMKRKDDGTLTTDF